MAVAPEVDAVLRSSQNLVSALAQLGTAEDPLASFEAAWDVEEDDEPPPPPPPPPPASEHETREAKEMAAERAALEAEMARRRRAEGQRCSTRLYQDAGERRELRMLQKVAREEGEAADCAFWPSINPLSERLLHDALGYVRRPLHERVGDLEREAAMRRVELAFKLREERSKVETFTPAVKGGKTRGRASERLAADAWRRAMAEKDRAAAAKAAAEAKRRSDAEFKASRPQPTCFEERQRRQRMLRQEKERKREAAEDAEREKLFKPTTTRRAAGVNSRGVEELSKDAQRAWAKREAQKQAELDDIPFAPTLVARQRRGRSPKPKPPPEPEKPTFKPKIVSTNASPRVFDDPKLVHDRREERRRRALRERELKELQECSFRPLLRQNRRRPSSPTAAMVAPVVVRGLARHLELRRRADQLQREQRDRERAAFHVDRASEWRNGQNYTTPVPFELSGVVQPSPAHRPLPTDLGEA